MGRGSIETNRRPEREVQAIRDTAEAFALIAGDDQLGADEDAEALLLAIKDAVYGAIVRATFEQVAHGRFTVTGPVVATQDNDIRAVGTWFVAQGDACAARLRRLKIIAAAGTHNFLVPKRITDWENDDVSREE